MGSWRGTGEREEAGTPHRARLRAASFAQRPRQDAPVLAPRNVAVLAMLAVLGAAQGRRLRAAVRGSGRSVALRCARGPRCRVGAGRGVPPAGASGSGWGGMHFGRNWGRLVAMRG